MRAEAAITKKEICKAKSTMQVCNISKTSRVSWDDARIALALNTLKTHDLNGAAKRLGVGRNSLRFALNRRGISVSAFRKRAIKGKGGRHSGIGSTKAFIDPHVTGENRPFLAMAAFEDRPANVCSWPIGDLDGDAFGFCNAPRTKGKPYCAQCAKRAYEAAPPLSALGLPRELYS